MKMKDTVEIKLGGEMRTFPKRKTVRAWPVTLRTAEEALDRITQDEMS